MTVCRYRHVLFDLDGTLFDTYEANMLSLKEVLTRMQPGVPHSDEELDALFGVPGLARAVRAAIGAMRVLSRGRTACPAGLRPPDFPLPRLGRCIKTSKI